MNVTILAGWERFAGYVVSLTPLTEHRSPDLANQADFLGLRGLWLFDSGLRFAYHGQTTFAVLAVAGES